MAGNTAPKREDFRTVVRRATPEPEELERHVDRLVEANESKMDGDGQLVLREEAVACFNDQLTHARNVGVSDPYRGSYVRSGERTFRDEGGSVAAPKWMGAPRGVADRMFPPYASGSDKRYNRRPADR